MRAQKLTVWQLGLQDDLYDLDWTRNDQLSGAPDAPRPVNVPVGRLGFVAPCQQLKGVAVDTEEDRVDDAVRHEWEAQSAEETKSLELK